MRVMFKSERIRRTVGICILYPKYIYIVKFFPQEHSHTYAMAYTLYGTAPLFVVVNTLQLQCSYIY